METLKQLFEQYTAQHPDLRDAITELAELAYAEIQAGESVENECELFEESVMELIERKA